MGLIHNYERNIPCIGEKISRIEIHPSNDNYKEITIYFEGGKHVTISTLTKETKAGIIKEIQRGNLNPEIRIKKC